MKPNHNQNCDHSLITLFTLLYDSFTLYGKAQQTFDRDKCLFKEAEQ